MARLTGLLTVKDLRKNGEGPALLVVAGLSPAASYPIHLACQSAGRSKPKVHSAGSLQGETRPEVFQSLTFQKYVRPESNGFPQ